jgi:hypothetical protein
MWPNFSAAAVIEQLPSALLEQMPAGTPPPGQVTNFIDPPNLLLTITSVLAISSFFVVLAVGLRFYSKLSSARPLTWDDGAYSLPKQIWDYVYASGRYHPSGNGKCVQHRFVNLLYS